MISTVKNSLTKNDLSFIGMRTEGYSCADLSALVKDVAMAPLRDVSPNMILSMDNE